MSSTTSFLPRLGVHLLAARRSRRALVVSTAALLAGAASGSAFATSWFVRTDGSDTACNGKSNAAASAAPSCAFKTVRQSAGMAVAGDNVNIMAGTYPESVTLSNSGTSASPVVFAATGATLKGNLKMTGQYVTVSGLTISPPTAGGEYAVSLSGTHLWLRNCLVTAYGAAASDQATAIGFEGGAYNTVEGCTIRDLNDIDVFHVWGHDNTIRGNYVTNVNQVNYAQNHTDFIQSWGYSGAQAYNILVENNVVTNSTAQLGNTETDGEAGLHDWTFRNNVFANIQNAFFWGIPSSRFYSNVFYNVGNAQGYALSLYTQTNYSSVGVEIVDNAFVANQGDVDFHSTSPSQLAAFTNNYFASASGGTKSGPQGSSAVNGGAAKFVNPAGADFHLQSGSVLIGRGKALATFTTDKDGNTRSGTWDIGSYRYGGVVPPQGVR
jgi:hypothetical protein